MPLPMLQLLGIITILVLSPAVYQFFRGNSMSLRQMWLYTIGFGLSLPLAAYVVIPAWFMTASGTWLGIIIAASITLYFPLVLLALVKGWLAFRSHNRRSATHFMILPALDAVVFLVIAFYFTFTSATENQCDCKNDRPTESVPPQLANRFGLDIPVDGEP